MRALFSIWHNFDPTLAIFMQLGIIVIVVGKRPNFEQIILSSGHTVRHNEEKGGRDGHAKTGLVHAQALNKGTFHRDTRLRIPTERSL